MNSSCISDVEILLKACILLDALMPPCCPYFFDFSTYAHAPLLQQEGPPWLILQNLSAYLHTRSLGVHQGKISSQAYLINPEQITIGAGSVVEPGAYIQGPCIIGRHCTIRHGAYIRGYLLTGDHCVIGHDTEIKHAILLDHVHAAHFAYVGDSILGNRVNLGAGVKCANLKLNQAPITVRAAESSIATHMRKLGAIIGDNTQIGCNVVLNPGTLVGQNVQCHPCVNLGGFIPSHSAVKSTVQPSIFPLSHRS